MDGRPWLRILLVLLGFLLLGIPVWTMTREKAQVVMSEKAPVQTGALRVSLTFAEAPTDFELQYLGATLCSGRGPQKEFTCDWNVGLSPDGADLLLTVNWPPGGAPTAVRVQVKKAGETLADQSIWGSGNVVETITVGGKS
ncbi:hypothetical protein BH09VER1_BH09VER1_41490 [soil metagenome]